MPLKGPSKGLLKAVGRPLKTFERPFKRPFKGFEDLSKAFEILEGLWKALQGESLSKQTVLVRCHGSMQNQHRARIKTRNNTTKKKEQTTYDVCGV